MGIDQKKMIGLVGSVRKKSALLAGIAALSLALNLYLLRRPPVKTAPLPPLPAARTYPVIKVLDGDSFVTQLDQSVRLANLDAPALENCFGLEAKANLAKLIGGRQVRIVSLGRDAYGRTLGLVYLDGEFINETIARQGWAKYHSRKSGPKDRVKMAAEAAKAQQLGVWSPACYQKENLENPKCLIKGNIGKSRGRKTYHFPGCNEYARTVVELDLGEQWFCTEEEARAAGYKKSEHCHGKSYHLSN